MKGDELVELFVARLVVRVLGDGVSGMRPPAVRVEKRPRWLLTGVQMVVDAMLLCIDRLDKLMCRSVPVIEDGVWSSVSKLSIKPTRFVEGLL